MFPLYVISVVSHFYVTILVTTPKIHILVFKWYKCLRYVMDKILSFVMKSHLITSNYVSIDVVSVVPQSIWERTELSFLHVQSISLCCIWCKYKSYGCAFFFFFKVVCLIIALKIWSAYIWKQYCFKMTTWYL